jgi:CelD/BcsL family acetyltransferase involved in cellulose biosynthesis
MTIANVLAASTDSVIPLLRSVLPCFGSGRALEQVLSDFGGVRAVGHRTWPQDLAFTNAWSDLLKRVDSATVFQTVQWQRAITAWPQRLDRLLLLAVWRGSRMIGVLPLQSSRGRRAESAGAVVSDYLDPLIDPAHEEDAWRAILTFLREQPTAPTNLTLRNVRPQASCRATLARLALAEGFTLREESHGSTCFLKLPRTWEEYLASLRSGDRKELRRKLNKAESQAGAALEPETDPAGNLERARHTFSLIEAGGGKRGMKCRWIFRGLLDASGMALAEQHWLKVFSLRLHDQSSAGVITFRAHNGLMAWATGYKETQKSWSPGIVAFALTIRRAIEEGAEYLDLLRGDNDYKARLGAEKRPLYELTLSRKA